jgi:hypothetical protein
MNLKSLLFGSAAILAAGTGAQAADLPVAEPVEFVRICDAFGTGFYYIPGTDTCLRISGRVRVEAHYVDEFDSDDDDDGDDDEFDRVDREFNNFTTRARGNVRLDARTQTDLGLVRAFIEYQMTVGPSDFGTNYAGADPDLVSAFIQISNDMGTFTAGHTASFFDFWGSNSFGTRVGIDDNTTEQTLFAYTASFGGAFSATLSLEDPASSGRRLNPANPFFRDADDLGAADILLKTIMKGRNGRIWSVTSGSTAAGARPRSWVCCTTFMTRTASTWLTSMPTEISIARMSFSGTSSARARTTPTNSAGRSAPAPT